MFKLTGFSVLFCAALTPVLAETAVNHRNAPCSVVLAFVDSPGSVQGVDAAYLRGYLDALGGDGPSGSILLPEYRKICNADPAGTINSVMRDAIRALRNRN